jgi:hypothetical protein
MTTLFKKLKFGYMLQRAGENPVPRWLSCIRSFRLAVLKQSVYLNYPVNRDTPTFRRKT